MRFVMAPFLIVGLVILGQCSWLSTKPLRVEPVARWEAIFFKIIDETTRVAKWTPLRETPLRKGDFEVRIWRGFGLSDLEGVSLRFRYDKWEASHIIGNDYVDITSASVTDLLTPRSGWDAFWTRLNELDLLTLPNTQDEDCYGMIDGTSYVVEINKDGIYRTYMYQSDMPQCPNSAKMDLIGEFIGLEFHDGLQQCQRAEWFPCTHLRRKYRLEEGLTE